MSRLTSLQLYQRESRRLCYFIQAASGHIKIGSAIDPERRMADLQVANPEPLKLLGTCGGGRTTELSLHRELAQFKAHREWFHPTPEVLKAIQEMIDLG